MRYSHLPEQRRPQENMNNGQANDHDHKNSSTRRTLVKFSRPSMTPYENVSDQECYPSEASRSWNHMSTFSQRAEQYSRPQSTSRIESDVHNRPSEVFILSTSHPGHLVRAFLPRPSHLELLSDSFLATCPRLSGKKVTTQRHTIARNQLLHITTK